MELSMPKNHKARVLYTLIKNGSASLKDFPVLAGFRTRISEITLDHNVSLVHKIETGVNVFGNSFWYKHHFLPPEEKEKAIEVYQEINIKRIK
jgi:hypothetical protein